MSSKKQILANRQNAQLGGVKTTEGKTISRFNSLKHGLLSKEVLLQGEDLDSFIQLGQRIRENIQPEGEIEVLLTERIIANVWRLRRALEVETALMEYEKFDDSMLDVSFLLNNPSSSDDQKRRKQIRGMILNSGVETVIRYETTIERGIYQALHELQRIQAVRMGIKSPLPLAVDITLNKNSDSDKNEE
jgi:hypothetical protein